MTGWFHEEMARVEVIGRHVWYLLLGTCGVYLVTGIARWLWRRVARVRKQVQETCKVGTFT